MSKAIESGDADVEAVKKSVTVIGYAEEGKYAETRGFAHALDDSHDYWADEERTNFSSKMMGGDEDLLNRVSAAKVWDKFADEETGQIEVDFGDAGEVRVVREKETYEDKRWGPKKAVKKIRDDIVESVYKEHGLTGLEKQFSWSQNKFQDEKSSTKVRARAESIGFERVLKPKDEREPGDRFKGEDEVMAVRFRFELGEADEELVNTWYKELVVPFMRELRKWDNIDNVEMTDCETHTVEQGDCFDI